MDLQFPHEIRNVTKEEDAIIKKYYKDYVRPFVRVGGDGYLAMAGYGDHAQDIYNLEVRPDDIWVTSFSRSGTTWLQELVWLIANDLNFEAIKANPINNRFAYIEYPTQKSEINKPPPSGGRPRATIDDFRTLPSMTTPRYIKTHLPMSLLPPKLLETAKVFYIARNPLDVVVSFHFAHKLFRYFEEDVTIKEFWDLFKKDLIMHTPLSAHVKEAWDQKEHPNLMFLFYEDLQRDLQSVIDEVSVFLGKEYNAEQKEMLVKHLNFDNMKKQDIFKNAKDSQNEKTFFRKGRCGGWVQYFDDEMKKEAAEYLSKSLNNTDMQYPEPK